MFQTSACWMWSVHTEYVGLLYTRNLLPDTFSIDHKEYNGIVNSSLKYISTVDTSQTPL